MAYFVDGPAGEEENIPWAIVDSSVIKCPVSKNGGRACESRDVILSIPHDTDRVELACCNVRGSTN